MMAIKKEIEQLEREARLLIEARDWLGLEAVLAHIEHLFLLDSSPRRSFYVKLLAELHRARAKWKKARDPRGW